MAAQVKHAMNNIADHLALPCGPVGSRLRDRLGDADKDVPGEPSRARGIIVIERDDIRRAFVPQVSLIEFGDAPTPDEMHPNFVVGSMQYGFEQGHDDLAKEPEIDLSAPL